MTDFGVLFFEVVTCSGLASLIRSFVAKRHRALNKLKTGQFGVGSALKPPSPRFKAGNTCCFKHRNRGTRLSEEYLVGKPSDFQLESFTKDVHTALGDFLITPGAVEWHPAPLLWALVFPPILVTKHLTPSQAFLVDWDTQRDATVHEGC